MNDQSKYSFKISQSTSRTSNINNQTENSSSNIRRVNKFLRVLLEILSNKSYSSIITWSDNGKSFTIIDIYKFTDTILSEHFKYTQLSNFIRQLNIYNFKKKRNQGHTYFNPHFHRDDLSRIHLIERKIPSYQRKNEYLSPSLRLPSLNKDNDEYLLLLQSFVKYLVDEYIMSQSNDEGSHLYFNNDKINRLLNSLNNI